MSTVAISIEDEIVAALATVIDPELDEPITALGFIRSITIEEGAVEVHLRLPTSFCAPNFAYLMISDAHDALCAVAGAGEVRVLLDDHHDSEKINAGTAAGLGYRQIFETEAAESLTELRRTFQRKAHLAAMERSCRAMLARRTWTLEELPLLEVMDLPEGPRTAALLRRREAIGLPIDPHALVMVDHENRPVTPERTDLFLRLAAATRISIEGNSHFCRGLLATRYADSDPSAGTGFAPLITNTRRSA